MVSWFYQKLDSPLCKKTGEPTEWLVFSRQDCRLLEETRQEAEVVGEHGLFEVHLRERSLLPIYWRSTPRPVRRAAWLRRRPKPKENACFWPLQEELSFQAEAAFAALDWPAAGAEQEEAFCFVAVGSVHILFVAKVVDAAWLCSEEVAQKTKVLPSISSIKGDKIYRLATPLLEAGSDYEQADSKEHYNHLVFVIHG